MRSRRRRYLAAESQILGEVVRQIAPTDRIDRRLDVVFDANELDSNCRGRLYIDNRKPGAPVAILWAADAAGVDEVDAVDHAMPGHMCVPERDDIARPRARRLG